MENGEDYDRERDLFLERMLRSAAGTFDMFSIYIGDRLGFYAALAENGPLTSDELAAKTGTYPRYTREWLEQQTVTGILKALNGKFSLRPWTTEVLTNRESLNYLTPLTRLMAGAVKPLEQLLAAYRTGGGVPYSDYGVDLREGQAAMNRTMFLQQLGQEWLPSLPELHGRLIADPPAQVAEIGCGAGWASIGIAQNYPNVRVDGFDLDAPSVELARQNAFEAEVANRVSFEVRDATDPKFGGKYDLVAVFEALHDMSQPVAALTAMRQLARPDGTVLVVDERVSDSFEGEWGEMDWMMYGWSILHCLPVGMAEKPSAETGTVMRSSTLEKYAREAGFKAVEVLPIDNLFFRFYRLLL